MQYYIVIVLMIALTLCACTGNSNSYVNSESDNSKIIGTITTKSLVPCSNGPQGCLEVDALSVSGKDYILVKKVFDLGNLTWEQIPPQTECTNDVCITYCLNSECYKQEDGEVFVLGKISKDETSGNYNLRQEHILLD